MTLGGCFFIRNGIQYDYCFLESLKCLESFCDEVVVLDAGSDDGTIETLNKNKADSTILIACNEWNNYHGREKLAYFQNLAKSFLSTDYYFLLQPDEILHEKSFHSVRSAIELGMESYLCSRINLWRDSKSYLNVPIERQPCNTSIIRLAKLKYDSVGDGESIDAPAGDGFRSLIRIYHMGFVRNKNVMKDKVFNMQENVFGITHDPKLDKSDVFDWSLWFSNEDLSPIKEPLPKFIQEWASTRP